MSRFVLLGALSLAVLASVTLADNFFYASSCSTPTRSNLGNTLGGVGGDSCDSATWFRFYSCDGGCHYHVQPWISSIFALIVYLFISAVVGCVVRCICCCR
ncbi:hypothetical protein L596_027270 [Steinernema carpocapsae]|uniref:Uncharacterized protein n=1 Tax=Steinernema carpocapsae TaxID=34508 RepID=A0A4U5M3V8_STECR|nr:hypothetical protein L596_027270 [Steinernema carpocapsae]